MSFILKHQTGNDIWDLATFFFNVFCYTFPPSAALLKQLYYKIPSNGSHTAPGSLGYTRGVRGDKWRSGVRRAAFSPSPPITSQAVRESDFLCSLSKQAWESGPRESWACTCAVLFTEKKQRNGERTCSSSTSVGPDNHRTVLPWPSLRLIDLEANLAKTHILDQEGA